MNRIGLAIILRIFVVVTFFNSAATTFGVPPINEEFMVWVEQSSNRVKRANLDGSGEVTLVHNLNSASREIEIDAVNGRLHWTDSQNGSLLRSNLDGSDAHSLSQPGHSLGGLALDVEAGLMYWTDFANDRIQRGDLNGLNVQTIVSSGLDLPAGGLDIDFIHRKLYWTDEGTDKIQRANLDGSNVEDLITMDVGAASAIALDVPRGKMYWTEFSNRIRRANLDGSGIETLLSESDLSGRPLGIALDLLRDKMYWTDYDNGRIHRADLDGTSVETLVTGLSGPVGIALYLVPEPSTGVLLVFAVGAFAFGTLRKRARRNGY